MPSKPSINRNPSQANRLPAPSLFIGPPSRNASDTSIIPPTSAAAGAAGGGGVSGVSGTKTPVPRGNPLSRQRSQRIEAAASTDGTTGTPLNNPGGGGSGSSSSSNAGPSGVSWKLDPHPTNAPPPPPLQHVGSPLYQTTSHASAPEHPHHYGGPQPLSSHHAAAATPDQPSTDAIWAEMQNTLEEVELSAAATTATHVFRPGHSHALDALRTAQIALAQAWARSEADEESNMNERDELLRRGGPPHQHHLQRVSRPLSAANVLQMDREHQAQQQQQKKGGPAADVGASAAVAAAASVGGGAGMTAATVTAAAAANRPRSGTESSMKSQLERDTENDIQLARARREANDRYFQRVNAGVLDVVAKLEGVARAMKGVEQESKEIWGGAGGGGVSSGSGDGSASVTESSSGSVVDGRTGRSRGGGGGGGGAGK